MPCSGGGRSCQHTSLALRSPTRRLSDVNLIKRRFLAAVNAAFSADEDGGTRPAGCRQDGGRSGSEFIDATAADVEQIEYINPFRLLNATTAR